MVKQIRYSSCKNTAYREQRAVQLRKYSVGVTLCSTRLPQGVSLLGQRGKGSRCQQGAVCRLGKQDACLAMVSSWVHLVNIKMKLKGKIKAVKIQKKVIERNTAWFAFVVRVWFLVLSKNRYPFQTHLVSLKGVLSQHRTANGSFRFDPFQISLYILFGFVYFCNYHHYLYVLSW